MTAKTFSSRELNQDASRAKRAAKDGPVIITDRGRPSHVLMTYSDFQRLTGRPRSLVETLAMPGLSAVDLDPPRAGRVSRDIDLS